MEAGFRESQNIILTKELFQERTEGKEVYEE